VCSDLKIVDAPTGLFGLFFSSAVMGQSGYWLINRLIRGAPMTVGQTISILLMG
jgi:hypothetical protein